jgi:hypothetical protein
MRWICQAEMSQSVGQKQITEIIRNVGRGDRVLGQQREPERDGEHGQQQHRPAGVLG